MIMPNIIFNAIVVISACIILLLCIISITINQMARVNCRSVWPLAVGQRFDSFMHHQISETGNTRIDKLTLAILSYPLLD